MTWYGTFLPFPSDTWIGSSCQEPTSGGCLTGVAERQTWAAEDPGFRLRPPGGEAAGEQHRMMQEIDAAKPFPA